MIQNTRLRSHAGKTAGMAFVVLIPLFLSLHPFLHTKSMNDLLDKSQKKQRKGIHIMSRIIRTSAGVKFPSKEDIFLDEQAKIAASKKLSMLAREKKEQAEFAEKCVCYAIPPEFYGIGCLSELDEYFMLVGLDGKNAKLRGYDRSGNERNIDVQFEEAMDMVARQTKAELHEVAAKAIMLYADVKSCSVRNDVRRGLRHIILTAENAKKLYNNSMTEILKNMYLPSSMLRAGWYSGTNKKILYELVSYRLDEDGKNFILENVCKSSVDPTRFKKVSFENLKKGLMTYAADMMDAEALELIDNMKDVDSFCSEVSVPVSRAVNAAHVQQLSFF